MKIPVKRNQSRESMMSSPTKNEDNSLELMLKIELKKTDYLDDLADDVLLAKMHDQIMKAVEQAEIKPISQWEKIRLWY
jgi:hypothetical protein